MMRLLLNENMFGWKMTGLIPKGAGWFFGFSRRSKEIAGEPRLVIYVPDGVTCAPNFDGEFECSCPTEHFDRWANSRGEAMDTIPKTESEFLAAVWMMRDLSKDAR